MTMDTKTLFVFLIVCFMSNISNGQRDKKFFRKDYKYLETTESFYKIHTIHRTWQEAKQLCALEGASFFYPEDDNEAHAVLEFWNATQPFRWVFVGISDLVAKGVFETIEGIPVIDVYSNWGPGEPNDANGNEDCVILRQDGTLNDDRCFAKYPFICKKTLVSLEWNEPCDMPNIDYKYNEQLARCYKFHVKPLNWTDAYAVCSAEQSYLAVINSQQEADCLVGLTESAPKSQVTGDYMVGAVHLGFHNRQDEGWQTVRGTLLEDSGYSKWGYGQPDGPARGVDERCGSMFYNGHLNDIQCDRKCFFICEHEISNAIGFTDRNDGQRDKKFFREDYKYIEAVESFYKFHTIPQSWLDAKRTCASEGAYLFFPENDAEANISMQYWKTTQPHITWLYVGISSLLAKGVFETVDGRPIGDVYHKWGLSQPDNNGDNEDCVGWRRDNTYNDYTCHEKYQFICKKTLASLEWNEECDMPKLDVQRNKKSFREDYKYIEAVDSFYKFHTIPQSWMDAKRTCESEGAYLFFPENNAEANISMEYWEATHPRITWLYVGISDLLAKGKFETVDGRPVENVYDKWGRGQPDDTNGNEDCVGWRRDNTYNDYTCHEKYEFICKKTAASLEWNMDYKLNEQLGRCYKFHMKPMNWADAHALCNAEQSYLAVINSQTEADHLVALTEKAPKDKVKGNYKAGVVLLGFHDRLDDGWQTVRGSSLEYSGYSTWGDDQPDGTPRVVDERCGSMFYNGTLNTVLCNKKSFFVCEHEISNLITSFTDREGDKKR